MYNDEKIIQNFPSTFNTFKNLIKLRTQKKVIHAFWVSLTSQNEIPIKGRNWKSYFIIVFRSIDSCKNDTNIMNVPAAKNWGGARAGVGRTSIEILESTLELEESHPLPPNPWLKYRFSRMYNSNLTIFFISELISEEGGRGVMLRSSKGFLASSTFGLWSSTFTSYSYTGY